VALNKANKIPNDGIANPFINLNGNVSQLGGVINTPNRGATTARPTTAVLGDQFFDTTTNVLQIFTTNGWVAAATKPDAPTNVVAASAFVPYGGLPGVRVTWGTATTAVPASSYTVTSNTGGFTATTTSNQVTFLGLTAGTSYTFTVAATNNYGSSSATSNAISPVTTPQAITVGTPTATAAGLSVPVTPGETGGSAITGYTLFAQPGNIVVSSATSPVIFNTNRPLVSGPISVGTRYSFSGIANNVAGPSTVSNTSASELNRPLFVQTGLTADYDFNRGSYGGNNQILYSEDFTNAAWQKGQVTVSNPGNIVAPDGTLTAQKMVTVNGAINRQSILQSGTSIAGNIYELSVCVKAAERRYVNLWWDAANVAEGAFLGAYQVFDLQTGSYVGTSTYAAGNVFSIDLGNGWYRLVVRGTATNTGGWYLNLSFGDANQNAFAPGIQTGDGTSGVLIWGAQARNASLSNSAPGYIKTVASAINYTTGSTIYDLSGNANNWTASNFTYSTTPTNGNGALMFNGTNTGGTLPSLGTNISNYSFSFWSNRFAESRMLIAGSAGYQFGDNAWAGSSGEWYYPRVADRGINTWNHTVIAVSSNNVYNIYHNGYLEGQLTVSGNTAANFSGVVLGNGYGAGFHWSGALGRMSLYINKTLTATEVLQNFNADRQRYGV
jgi:hypothetical protein